MIIIIVVSHPVRIINLVINVAFHSICSMKSRKNVEWEREGREREGTEREREREWRERRVKDNLSKCAISNNTKFFVLPCLFSWNVSFLGRNQRKSFFLRSEVCNQYSISVVCNEKWKVTLFLKKYEWPGTIRNRNIKISRNAGQNIMFWSVSNTSLLIITQSKSNWYLIT